MPTLDEAIYARLASMPDVAALVAGRIWPDQPPQSAGRAAPWLEYEVEEPDNDIDLDGAHPTGQAEVTIRVVAAALADAESLGLVLRSGFPGAGLVHAGVTIDAILPDDEADTYDGWPDGGDSGRHQVEQSYTVLFQV
jgi:hypothetical protein